MRFTIRDLMLVTLVVAIGGAWWVDRRRLAEYQAAEKREIERQQAEKRLKDMEMEYYAAKGTNEWGIPKPHSQRTPEEKNELGRAAKALFEELSRRNREDNR